MSNDDNSAGYTVYGKDEDAMVSEHFSVKEFRCPCDNCHVTIVDHKLVELLESLRGFLLGRPITIDQGGGYRCEFYQLYLKRQGFETSKGRSTHEDGKAADILVVGMTGEELEAAARAAGFKAVGVAQTWCHVDTRPDFHRWTYARL